MLTHTLDKYFYEGLPCTGNILFYTVRSTSDISTVLDLDNHIFHQCDLHHRSSYNMVASPLQGPMPDSSQPQRFFGFS